MRLKFVLSFLTVMIGICLSPIVTFACGRANIPQPLKMTERRNLSDWRGQYSFTERVPSKPLPVTMNYMILLSVVRCPSMFATMKINGPSTALDFRLEVAAIDSDTIGL